MCSLRRTGGTFIWRKFNKASFISREMVICASHPWLMNLLLGSILTVMVLPGYPHRLSSLLRSFRWGHQVSKMQLARAPERINTLSTTGGQVLQRPRGPQLVVSGLKPHNVFTLGMECKVWGSELLGFCGLTRAWLPTQLASVCTWTWWGLNVFSDRWSSRRISYFPTHTNFPSIVHCIPNV